MDRVPDPVGLQPGVEPCFFCGDPDEGDGYRHNGVPICVTCDDIHMWIGLGGGRCCDHV